MGVRSDADRSPGAGMSRRAVVFVGPSLPEALRDGLTSVAVRPPARRGDLCRAVAEGYAVIGLIDGEFLQSLAVTPEEVRHCAALGALLFGAASMGALRAADCPEAMVGLGAIAAGYRTGRITREDEVALTWDPATLAPIAWPMVEIRAAVALALRRGVLDRSGTATIVRAVARLHFPDRTLPQIRALARVQGADPDALVACLLDPSCRLKRADATVLVARLTAEVCADSARSEPSSA